MAKSGSKCLLPHRVQTLPKVLQTRMSRVRQSHRQGKCPLPLALDRNYLAVAPLRAQDPKRGWTVQSNYLPEAPGESSGKQEGSGKSER